PQSRYCCTADVTAAMQSGHAAMRKGLRNETFQGPPLRLRGPGELPCPAPGDRSALELLEPLAELGEHLEEVGDQPVVGHLEDGRLGVLVDGHDGLASLHAGEVLDGARDARGDV